MSNVQKRFTTRSCTFLRGDTNALSVTNHQTGNLGQFFVTTFLPTIEVHVKTPSGNLEKCRALLDTGSDSSFIREQCVQKLALPRRRPKISVTGISGTSTVFDLGTSYLQLVDRLSRVHQVSAFNLREKSC